MTFRTMSPALILRLLHGETDQLTDLQQSRISSIKRTPCPRCGSSLHPQVREDPFSAADPLPRMLATCECGYAQDTTTGLVVSMGSAAKVKDPLPIVGKD